MAKIMLVEDDTNLSEIYQARLTAEGYEIVSAHDGEEALALAAKEKPDLIVSDVMMPKISGFEMLDILRNTEGLKETKVIMLTALGQADDKTRADSLGADRYLVKSQVTLEDIVKAAQELLTGTTSPTTTPDTVNASTVPATQVAPAPTPTPMPVAAPAPVAVPTPAPTPVAIPPVNSMPVAAPAPAPAPVATPPVDPVAPANPTVAADNKLVADAVDDLMESIASKPATTPNVAATPTPVPSTPEPTTTDDSANGDGNNSSGGSHKKIIKPITDDTVAPKPSLESLLANEERKNADSTGSAATINTATTNAPVTEVPHQPGHIITPSAAESLNNGSGIDPNSIAL